MFCILTTALFLFPPPSRIQPCSSGWTRELLRTSSIWALQRTDELSLSPLRAPALASGPADPVRRAATRDKKDSGLYMRWSFAPRRAELDNRSSTIVQLREKTTANLPSDDLLRSIWDSKYQLLFPFSKCQICLYLDDAATNMIPDQKVSYAIIENQWVGYDNAESLETKVKHISLLMLS